MTERGVKIGWMKAGMATVAMVATLLLVACSSGGDAPEAPPTPPTDPTEPTTPTTPEATSQLEIPIYVSMSAGLFEDGKGRQANRAWAPPTDYYLYSNLYGESYENQPNLGQSPIDVFMTHDDGDATTEENPLHARLSYSSATDKWKLGLPHGIDETAVSSGNYYAYGFIPQDAADSAKLEHLPKSSNWADGAVLTIKGLKAVATDPCIIIGAKEGPNANTDNGLQAGDFKFHLDTGKTTVDGKEVINPNYLYFLFDHLYSALNISMRVNGDYDALRHIKLKGLKLRTQTSTGTPYKSDVTITLRANNEGANPIVDSDISYGNIIESETEGTIYSNNEGYPLTTSYSLFLGHFLPQGVTKLILTSIYDVYDTNITSEHPDGNLIREDCSATNTLVLSELFSGQTESYRGWKYTVKLTINPTYLYMMSDPDLNNPTVVVE